MNMDLQTAYERIQNSKSPIGEVGKIILETGDSGTQRSPDWMHKTREFLGAEMVLDRI
jgi:hypothetical protein